MTNNNNNNIKDERLCIINPEDGSYSCPMANGYSARHSHDWSKNSPNVLTKRNLVEVRFKNGRKGIYENKEDLFLKDSDVVAVEATSGHDIGLVSLQGEIMAWQIKKYGITDKTKLPQIYRKARTSDIEKWQNAISRETEVLKRSKQIIEELSLKMKLGDVEFQGDGSKATFYYISEARVDFRELIKILAVEFKIRIEMRQIGARQESAKIGGLGTCGRELCCISWKREFESVTTNSARHQEMSLNPTKLAGQCCKLKCCLNYELKAYKEARQNFPDTSIILKTKGGDAFFQKSDVFKKMLWYSLDPDNSINITALTVERVEEIIEMNKNNILPETLLQNNLELADRINSKHNVKITSDEIKETSLPLKPKKKPNNKRRRNNKNFKNNNKKRPNNNNSNNQKNNGNNKNIQNTRNNGNNRNNNQRNKNPQQKKNNPKES